MAATERKRVLGVSSDVVRGINRRLAMNLIRTRQPLSRDGLARHSGLQRSTVSLIIEDLISENWVLEGPTERLPRGRHPTFLRLNDDRVILSADLHPSRIIAALQRIIAASEGKKIEGIGIALPGRYDVDTNRVVFTPNLKWPEFELIAPIAQATGYEVVMAPATNACVLAAAWFDNKDSVRDMVVITVSEGIGAGLFMNGQLVRGYRDMAGEFGHVPIDVNGPLCGCGSHGCWEVFASNAAALRYFAEARPDAPAASFPALLDLADAGDEQAMQALDKMAHFLARGMRVIVAGIAPQRIVVIGDLTRSWERFGPVLEAQVKGQVLRGGIAPQVAPAHEDGLARLRGTVALVLQRHFGSSMETPA